MTGVELDVSQRRALGRTGLQVTPVCVGSGPLGSVPQLFGYETPFERAVETVLAAFDSPLNFLDTSAGYSDGESERRIGEAIARRGGLPAGWVLATKVDPDPATGAFDAAAVRRSVEGSLERLRAERFDLLYLHDPHRLTFATATASDGPVAELVKLRDEGFAEHLGVADGPVGNLLQFLGLGVFEVVLTHNRHTLLDRSAEPLLAHAAANGIAVVQGAPFGGGVLAKGPDVFDTYAYHPMSPDTRARAEALAGICRRLGVPLGAAALQFSLREPRITSTVVGITRPERVQQAIDWAQWEIPDAAWQEITAATGADAGLDNDER
jgi:D-threo-aldose 1-dehydrogenase